MTLGFARLGLVLTLAIGLSIGPAGACGLHRPVDFERGLLNHVYPDSLHVLGATWQARQSGILVVDAAGGSNLSGPFAFHGLTTLLRRFGDGLATEAPPEIGGFSLVMVDNLLWTRFRFGQGGVVSEVHSDGPGKGDVVVVTHSLVMDALVAGRLDGAEAIDFGLLRVYGTPDERDRLVFLLAAMKVS